MKLSAETKSILKNFSLIENSIYCNEEGVLKIVNGAKSVIAVADIEETFPEFGVYDLSAFNQIISLFDDVDIEFKRPNATVKSGKRKVQYRLTDKELISNHTQDASRYHEFDDFDVTFKMSFAEIQTIIKSGKILGTDIVTFTAADNECKIGLYNSENSSAHTYEDIIESTGDGEISMILDNLVMKEGDYNVSISSQKIAKFETEDKKLMYIITMFTG
jgi:hypothetical protein